MTSTRLPTSQRTHAIAWQGWSVTVPHTWNPVKVDGDADSGSLLLADLHAARLGLRWKRLTRKREPADAVGALLADEVGRAAVNDAVDFVPKYGEWSAGRFYRDRAMPGRDVFVGHSRRSGRLIQVVHHAEKRSSVFADALLPTLTDTPADAGANWSIFDLSFRTPPGVGVRWYRFNAGDLSAGLADAGGRVTIVRQVGPAALALARQPLANWARQLPSTARKLYRPIHDTEPATLVTDGGRTITGVRATLRRRRRLWWAWMVAPRQATLAFHDADRDRLVLGQGVDEDALRTLLATVGHAAPTPEDD